MIRKCKSIIGFIKDRYKVHVRPHLTPEGVRTAGEVIRWILWLIER